MISGCKQAGGNGISNLDTHTLAGVPEVLCRSWPRDQPLPAVNGNSMNSSLICAKLKVEVSHLLLRVNRTLLAKAGNGSQQRKLLRLLHAAAYSRRHQRQLWSDQQSWRRVWLCGEQTSLPHCRPGVAISGTGPQVLDFEPVIWDQGQDSANFLSSPAIQSEWPWDSMISDKPQVEPAHATTP
jgi:hypothetical protein